jgi:D-ornithine 4,5-aminomutase subunit alpha
MTTSERNARYEQRRAELKTMSDEQLKTRFWQLCDKVAEPMVELSKTHTSPSIERSVLMRMGIDSITAAGVVAKVVDAGLLGKGAGHAVLKVSQKMKTDIRGAAKRIVENPEILKGLFA